MYLKELKPFIKPILQGLSPNAGRDLEQTPDRLLVVGDIHGCHREFEQLLNLLSPGPRDLLILLGDLVNHGPDSHRVIRLAEEARAMALLGNHERRLLRIRRGVPGVRMKRGDRATLPQFTPADWDFLQRMRHFYHFAKGDLVFVHGGFLPDRPWRLQPASITTRIQVVDHAGRPLRRAQSPHSPHWSALWHGPPFVVYGHTPRSKPHRRPWSLGLDTGCVHGGCLSACIWPDEKIVQVPARAPYSKL